VSVPSLSLRIDWLSATKKEFPSWIQKGSRLSYSQSLNLALWCFRNLSRSGDFETTKPNPHYGLAWRERQSGIVIHVPALPLEQGVLVVASGHALGSMENAFDFLKVVHHSGWKATRIDVAYDLMDTGWNASLLAAEWQKANGEGSKRYTHHIVTTKGDTFYIGSRSSPKMLRIYDKGLEQKTSLDWLRIEIELKHAAAKNALSMLATSPYAATKDVLKLLALPQLELTKWIAQAGGGGEGIKSTAPRVNSSRFAWIRDSVLPALEKMKAEEPHAYKEIIEMILAQY